MALLTVADVIALMHSKAKQASVTIITNFLNTEVKEDIKAGLFSTFETDFIRNVEIDIDTDVATEYSLPADFYINLETVDQDGRPVDEGLLTSLDKDRNLIRFGVDGSGDPIVIVDADATFTKLIIKYEYLIGNVTNSNDVLPYPNNIAHIILPILASGASYFYFEERSKTVEIAITSTRYEDLKSNIFKSSIISI